jgi:hypothetical protein
LLCVFAFFSPRRARSQQCLTHKCFAGPPPGLTMCQRRPARSLRTSGARHS